MAHVTLVEKPRGLLRRAAFRYSRREFGRPVEPVMAAAHHGGVLLATGALETAVAKGWKRLDPHLRGLVLQLVSTRIGCSWCIDYGYYELMQQGSDPAKVRAVAQWRTSPLFDDRERAVLEYAELVTATPVSVEPEVVARLRRHLGEAEMVELAGWVALENLRSRFNGGLGLRSQGFAESCAVPPSPRRDEPAGSPA